MSYEKNLTEFERTFFKNFATKILYNSHFLDGRNFLPSRRGNQPLTVLPRSTSTRTRRPSIFFPSACLYAAVMDK